MMAGTPNKILQLDLNEIINRAEDDLRKFGSIRCTIFGGTGFVGRWLVSVLTEASSILNLDINVEVVTRSTTEARAKLKVFWPNTLENVELLTIEDFFKCDNRVSDIEYPHIYIFGATPTTNFPKSLASITNYFERILDKVSNSENPPIVLNLSSGAVYKNSFKNFSLIQENDERETVQHSVNIYQECKIRIEDLLFQKTLQKQIRGINARLFTFAGPGFPIEAHFAVSSFVRSSLEGLDLEVKGNTSTSRSYMDPVDMASWLIRLVARQENVGSHSVHIGSEDAINMAELSRMVLNVFSGTDIKFIDNGVALPNSYVPSTSTTRSILDVETLWTIERTLEKWRDYLLAQRNHPHSRWE